MSYLFFSILSSVLVANLLALFNRSGKRQIVSTFLGNYFVAAIFSLLMADHSVQWISWVELGFAFFAGSLFLYNFFVYYRNIGLNGMSVSVSIMRIAVIIPIVLSIFLFVEKPGIFKILGICAALCAFWLLKENRKLANLAWILLLFVITGATDLSLKIFTEYGGMDDNLFLFFLFSAAYVFTLLWILLDSKNFDLASLGLGFLLGIPNQLSSLFFLKGLATVPAVLAYPLTASGIVLLSIASDSLIWKKRFSLYQRIAFLLLIIGIILLNLRLV